MSNLVYPYYKAWKANGTSPAAGYYLYTYKSGTLIAKPTYSDVLLTIPNANPIVLDSNGEATIFGEAGDYRFDLKTPGGALINTFDPVQSTGSGGAADYVTAVPNIAALKAIITFTANTVEVEGYYDEADLGGGTFWYDPTSVAVENSGTIFIPNSAPATGRWFRLYTGPVSVKWFGWTGAGGAPDATALAAFQTFCQALTLGGQFWSPGTITIKDLDTNHGALKFVNPAVASHAGGIEFYEQSDLATYKARIWPIATGNGDLGVYANSGEINFYIGGEVAGVDEKLIIANNEVVIPHVLDLRIEDLAGASTRFATIDTAGVVGVGAIYSAPVDGSGTLNYLPKWTPDGNTLGNSPIFTDGAAANLFVSTGTRFSSTRVGASGYELALFQSNGTVGVPTNSVANDRTGVLSFNGYNAGAWGVSAITSTVTALVGPAVRGTLDFSSFNVTVTANGNTSVKAWDTGFIAMGAALTALTSASTLGLLHLGADSGSTSLYIQNAGGSPQIFGRRSGGTLAAPANSAIDEVMLTLTGQARSTTFFDTTTIKLVTDAAIVAGQAPASRIEFATEATNSTPTTRMVIYKDGIIGIGTFSGTIRPESIAGKSSSILQIASDVSDNANIWLNTFNNAGLGGNLQLGRARGSTAVPTAVVDGDGLGEIEFFGYTGTNGFQHAAEIVSYVDGAVVNNQIPPSRLEFRTSVVNVAVDTKMAIYSNGFVAIGAEACAAGLSWASVAQLQVGSENSTSVMLFQRSAADAFAPAIFSRQSRGTIAAPTATLQNDNIGRWSAQSYIGNGFSSSTRINAYIDLAPVANQIQAGRFEFETSSTNNASPTPKVVITRLGVLALSTSGTAPVTSGDNYGAIQIMSTAPVSGIYLGNAANSALNVLDWYEEGTWTPAFAFGTAQGTTGITYSSRTGRFTRIGNRVFCKFSITLSSKGSSTGAASISGLPYAIANTIDGGYSMGYANFIGLVGVPMWQYDGTLAAATTSVIMKQFGAISTANIADTAFNNNSSISGCLIYECAT